jgi:IPT/TIG domain
MKRLISPRCRRVLSGTTMAACLVAIFIPMFASFAQAINPVPFVNQPLVPDTVAPGGPGFTLTVNGTGFVSGSVVHWNGSARATHFVSEGQLTATILAADVATALTAAVTVVSPSPGGGPSNAIRKERIASTSTIPRSVEPAWRRTQAARCR